MKSKIQASP